MIDWNAIRLDYEDGISLRSLASKYGVPKTTIIRHQQAEEWERTAARSIERTVVQPPASEVSSLALTMVKQLTVIAKVPLDLKEHKLFADSLSQYHKILITDPAMQATETQSGPIPAELLPFVHEDELATIDAILARAQERKAEADSKVTPIRKQA